LDLSWVTSKSEVMKMALQSAAKAPNYSAQSPRFRAADR
jgi:hypothetical protein